VTRVRVRDSRSNPRELGTALGQTIRNAAPAIVNGLIDQATHGNTAPAKFLFDFAGLSSASAADPQQEDCLAALLLKELARASSPPQDAEGDTVQ
jgi:hypothetical protein